MTTSLVEIRNELLSDEAISELFQQCFDEDGLHIGDVTTESIIDVNTQITCEVSLRGAGVIAGLALLPVGLSLIDDLELKLLKQDGAISEPSTIAVIGGNHRSILAVERTILNILGYASGIATRTHHFVELVAGTECKICDTRKTTPSLRMLDKYAVACGGGTLHRLGLHDAVLYKDNHLAGLANINEELANAISKVRRSQISFVEVEVDTLEQFAEVIDLDVDIILLDNMSNEMIRKAVEIRNASKRSPLLEASGGVNADTVKSIAETGVDRIAIGGLTHQATWLDFGLDVRQ
ncbi:MAG: carboxylating nicotinate-nucleotide diphosphorylase [Planctomycetota bacterium]|nr:carboxylating nicotinate-nucleotide diphosphorylase [Planctomycetota bacterium]